MTEPSMLRLAEKGDQSSKSDLAKKEKKAAHTAFFFVPGYVI